MTKHNAYLTYALNVDGKLVHIDSVSTGLSCKCFCPHCKGALIAKNRGVQKIHHFSHTNGSECEGAIESALHKMAKDILQEYKVVMMPFTEQSVKEQQIVLKRVDLEVFNKELLLRPDCVGYTENGRVLWVEFKRSHEVDVKKAGKIISAKIDCVEIDINTCELDPIKVRNFIEDSSKNRKWIYNHASFLSFERLNNDINPSNFHYDGLGDFCQREARHIAVDEQGTIVNLKHFYEIDTINHTYFCIACGKEVFVHVDDWGNYSFVHLQENTPCKDGFYLHEAAKKVFQRNFNSQQKFEVYIPKTHLCENAQQCLFYNKKYCFAKIPICYDLNLYGYDSSEIEYKFPNELFPYDVVLKRGCQLKNAIIIIINVETYFIVPENLKNRAIEIIIRCENDVFNLSKNVLRGDNLRFYNFEEGVLNVAPKEKINRKLLKFTLYSSGKYYFGLVSCMASKRRTAIYEMVFSEDIGDYYVMKLYALLHCYKKHKNICLCEICYYLRNDIYNESICIMYKKKGTPKNPLNSMPINCPHFILNRRVGVLLERESANLKFLEFDIK